MHEATPAPASERRKRSTSEKHRATARRLRAQNEALKVGHRAWLAAEIECAVAAAPPGCDFAYLAGWLLGASALPEQRQSAILDALAKAESRS